MKRKTVAIGLDCPNNTLFENWLQRGLLPNIATLRGQSSQGVLTHHKKYSNQNSWIPFLTGRSLDTIDDWVSTYKPKSYENTNHCLYNQHEYQPFYAVKGQARVVMFDLPVAISNNVEGIQVVGWASELNETFPASEPASALAYIHEKYGMDPKLEGALKFYNRDLDRHGLSYRVPSSYDIAGLQSFRDKILASTATRGRICREFLQHEDWDLFLSVFSEIHVGGHTLWHLSQEHPLASLSRAFDSDPLLEIYQAVDHEIGLIAELVGKGSDLVLFSVDSLVNDCLENARSLFLPEFLYRWNFPGKAALAAGDTATSLPKVRFDYPLHWKDEIWKLRTDDGDRELQSPQQQSENNDTFNWQPTNWYKPLWQKMQAFALPSVADGYIRINVKGREAHGIVEPGDYRRICNEIIKHLSELVDARTGRAMVERVIQTRSEPFENDSRQSPADLIVLWQEESPTDVVKSPLTGRIGPIPYFRPGGHQKQGSKIENFFMIRAADCPPGLCFEEGSLEDLPATILSRMGIATPQHFDGRPLQLIGNPERVSNG
jgi:predicted AlkP superfamily phosphohydrolase/phosphomutase